MLMIPANARLFLCQQPVSMKKSFEGLSTIVEELFPKQLLTGALFIFLNRNRNHMKVLSWDGDGFVIWYKRLEKGTFSVKGRVEEQLTRRAFLMLLEGVTPKRLQSRFSL
jgi:transposase